MTSHGLLVIGLRTARQVNQGGPVLIRRESPGDAAVIRSVTASAFAPVAPQGQVPVEATLVDELRADPGWLPALSLVAVEGDAAEAGGGEVTGHVVCTRAHVADVPVLGLGPLSVRPDLQRGGVGSALVHAVIGAADALGEPLVALLGSPAYYRRFGFRTSTAYGITPPVAEWGEHFQVRTLSSYRPELRGPFRYAEPFDRV